MSQAPGVVFPREASPSRRLSPGRELPGPGQHNVSESFTRPRAPTAVMFPVASKKRRRKDYLTLAQDQTPAPGQYAQGVEAVRPRAQGGGFSKGSRQGHGHVFYSSFNEQGPAPGQYSNNDDGIRFKNQSVLIPPPSRINNDKQRSRSPAPGEYNVHDMKSRHGGAFAKSPRLNASTMDGELASRNNGLARPGPGQYNT